MTGPVGPKLITPESKPSTPRLIGDGTEKATRVGAKKNSQAADDVAPLDFSVMLQNQAAISPEPLTPQAILDGAQEPEVPHEFKQSAAVPLPSPEKGMEPLPLEVATLGARSTPIDLSIKTETLAPGATRPQVNGVQQGKKEGKVSSPSGDESTKDAPGVMSLGQSGVFQTLPPVQAQGHELSPELRRKIENIPSVSQRGGKTTDIPELKGTFEQPSTSQVPPSALDVQLAKTGLDRFGAGMPANMAILSSSQDALTPLNPEVKRTSSLSGDDFIGMLNSRNMGAGAQKHAAPEVGTLLSTGVKSVAGKESEKGSEQSERLIGDLKKDALTFKPQDLNLDKANDGLSFAMLNAAPRGPQAPPMNVTGNVIPGSLQKNRLSTDSVVSITGGIKDFKNSGGGGEIKIKLHPETLGEISLRVVTQGNDVGLAVTASDAGAKRIIEESMGSLKDKLAESNLHLKTFEVSLPTVADVGRSGHPLLNTGDQGGSQYQSMNQSSQNQQQSMAQYGNGESGGRARGDAQDDWNSSGTGGLRRQAAPVAPARVASHSSGSGRIDIKV